MTSIRIVPFSLAALFAISACSSDGGGGGVPEIVTFSASKTAATAGDIITLTWETKNAVKVTITSVPAEVGGGADLPASGTLNTLPLTADATFKIVATGEERDTVDQSITVTVSGVAIVSFTANPSTITRKESTM